MVTTLVGAVPPGATAATKMDVKTAFRAPTVDTMTVELTFRPPARPNHESYQRRPKSGPPRASHQRRLPQPRRRSLKSTGLPGRGSAPAARPRSKNAGPSGGRLDAGGCAFAPQRSHERVRIPLHRPAQRRLVYTAMPNGRQPATDFTLTKIEQNSVTFENPAHDFPKMVRYTLGADGTLEAVVSGTEQQKPQVFRVQEAMNRGSL